MKYDLFLFDADDTLFDFKKSEEASFSLTMQEFGIEDFERKIFDTYKKESFLLWQELEKGKVTKDFLRVERFRRTLDAFGIDSDPEKISETYLEFLPEQVNLIDHAKEICEHFSSFAKIGIVTNGIEKVQRRRLEISGLKEFISFMVVSEECGFVKPDPRFFEYTMSLAGETPKARTLVIGDRLETDVKGANFFGLDSCWYNPSKIERVGEVTPNYQINSLLELREIANVDNS